MRRPILVRLFASSLATVLALGTTFVASSSVPSLLAAPKDASTADVDGPYLFETEGGGWTAKRVVKGPQGPAATTEKIPADKPQFELPIPGLKQPLVIRVRPLTDPPPCVVPAPDALLAVSDIEGNVDKLIALLQAGKVVDDDLKWTYGKGRLVLVGDFFDRGLYVTETLWLLYELQGRAQAAGGDVEFVLGNHEVMNLTGDFRYVRKKYQENATLLGEKLEDLYTSRTVLGRWLRTRNCIVRIGDELFLHGGLSPTLARTETDIAKMNDCLRTVLLADGSVRHAEGLLGVVAGNDGPLWYRGCVGTEKLPQLSEKAMDEVLGAFKAKRVVIGHTIVPAVGLTLGGRVLTLDVEHADGISQAAVRDKTGQWYRLTPDGKREKL